MTKKKKINKFAHCLDIAEYALESAKQNFDEIQKLIDEMLA
jgi:hypothetical protein